MMNHIHPLNVQSYSQAYQEDDFQDTAILIPSSPIVKVAKLEGKVQIEFEKADYDGVMIYSRRGSEDDFKLVSVTADSPYLDKRTNLFQVPELREYKVRYFKHRKPVGNYAEIKIIVK